jgi:hypothetical protein
MPKAISDTGQTEWECRSASLPLKEEEGAAAAFEEACRGLAPSLGGS